MSLSEIKTITEKEGTDGDWTRVTGTDVAGDKRAIDVAVKEGSVTLSGLNIAGLVTIVPLNASTWTALPAAALTNRNAITIQNTSGIEIKLNYSDLIVGYVGVVVGDGGERYYDVTDGITIYAKAASGTPSVTVEELS